MQKQYIENIEKQFNFYKNLGIKTFQQLSDEELNKEISKGSNSISTIVKHLHGNMLSRFTDFLTSDGEKDWRKRDREFEQQVLSSIEIETIWEEGWNCVFDNIKDITDIKQIVLIRNQKHTVYEALNRQLAHYAYHVGQIVFLGKVFQEEEWLSLSIPRNGSKAFNESKFKAKNTGGHYTDDFIK